MLVPEYTARLCLLQLGSYGEYVGCMYVSTHQSHSIHSMGYSYCPNPHTRTPLGGAVATPTRV